MKQDILKQYTALRTSLESERAEIKARLSEIEAALGGEVSAPTARIPASVKRRRKMSAAGKARIKAAAKARWAAYRAKKAGRGTAGTAKPRKQKGQLSAAGRARIIAAQKIRWAKAKAKAKA
jgi:hypothetical protein